MRGFGKSSRGACGERPRLSFTGRAFLTCLSMRSIRIEDYVRDPPTAVRDQQEIAAGAHPMKPERRRPQSEITPVVNDEISRDRDEALTAHPDTIRRRKADHFAVDDRPVHGTIEWSGGRSGRAAQER